LKRPHKRILYQLIDLSRLRAPSTGQAGGESRQRRRMPLDQERGGALVAPEPPRDQSTVHGIVLVPRTVRLRRIKPFGLGHPAVLV
jgi:hypothetical protein